MAGSPLAIMHDDKATSVGEDPITGGDSCCRPIRTA